MAMQLSGRLTLAAGEQPSFQGCRVIALFDQKRAGNSRAPTALSDATGSFTLTCPDGKELVSETVTFIALSPAAHFIGETEVLTADLGDAITIEVERFDPAPVGPAPPAAAPDHLAVDSLFRTDAAFRAVLTANLKPLRAESDAISNRVEVAFSNFHPTPLSAEELATRHYVAHGASPAEVLNKVISDGVHALGSGDVEHTLILRKSDELTSLMTEAPGEAGSVAGHIDLLKLISFINGKSAGGSVVNEPTYAQCQAELEAEGMLSSLENAAPGGNGNGVPRQADAPDNAGEVDQLVKDSVNLQMHSATAPEARLDYGSMPVIPNAADTDKVQSSILQTFELRPGASDVTSYHDFYTLQIAFQHVWTQIFDGQLESLGRDLYREYVKLKDFSGSADPDPGISTVDDLRQLMDEVRKLSQVVQESIPDDLRGTGDAASDNGPKSSDELSNTAKLGVAVATGGASWLLEWALDEFSKIGRKPIIRWDDFPGPWPPRQDKIYLTFADDVVPAGSVEVVLKTDYASHIKIIEFEPWDPDAKQFVHGPQISNTGHIDTVTMPLRTSQIASGVLEFASEESTGLNLGRYVLGNLTEKLKDGTRVTFYWKDN